MRNYYIAACLIAVFAIASYGLYHEVSKAKLADQTKMDDIQQLQEKIDIYAEKHKLLPVRLVDLDLANQKVATRLADYTYTPKGRSNSDQNYSYEICADFQTEVTDSNNYSSSTYFDAAGGHKKGHSCFTLTSYAL